MNQTITITGLVIQEFQAFKEKLVDGWRPKQTTPFGIRSSSNHKEWFYLVEKSEEISIWKKGNSIASLLYPSPYLYFSMEHHNEGKLTRLNREHVSIALSTMGNDAVAELKRKLVKAKHGKIFSFFNAMQSQISR